MSDIQDWLKLRNSAIWLRHTGDISGAIEEMKKAITLAKTKPNFAEETAVNTNYLADLYLLNNDIEHAEIAIRDAIEISRPLRPSLLGDNLWILSTIQIQKGEYLEALASAQEARRVYQQAGHDHGVAQADELIEKIRAIYGWNLLN